MSVDYIVASLPTLSFDVSAPISWGRFCETIGGDPTELLAPFADIEVQLRNAVAEARGGAAHRHPATGCSLYWKNRILAAFQEKDVFRRDELLDRVWWDAAGELTPPSDPLGKGALATYAIRLKIALKRSGISKDRGNAAFDRLTAATKI